MRAGVAALWLLGPMLIGCAATPTTSPISSRIAAPTASPQPSPTQEAWTFADLANVDVRDVAEGGGLILAVGYTYPVLGGTILASTDAVTWQPVDLSELRLDSLGGSGIDLVAYGPHGFVATGGRFGPSAPLGSPFLLFSPDGLTWEEVTYPEHCTYADSLVAGDFGYAILGGRCRTEAEFDPRPIRLLTSSDGRNWTSTTDALTTPSSLAVTALATDGHRIVALLTNTVGTGLVWTSDDGGASWLSIDAAFPAGIQPGAITFGHGLFVVTGGVVEAGISVPHTCTSPDGEEWGCHVADSHFPTRELAVTPTGFATVTDHPLDPMRLSHSETTLLTSFDGSSWSVIVLPELTDHQFRGTEWTSHGLLAWGGTAPEFDPSGFSVPFLVRYGSTLP